MRFPWYQYIILLRPPAVNKNLLLLSEITSFSLIFFSNIMFMYALLLNLIAFDCSIDVYLCIMNIDS